MKLGEQASLNYAINDPVEEANFLASRVLVEGLTTLAGALLVGVYLTTIVHIVLISRSRACFEVLISIAEITSFDTSVYANSTIPEHLYRDNHWHTRYRPKSVWKWVAELVDPHVVRHKDRN